MTDYGDRKYWFTVRLNAKPKSLGQIRFEAEVARVKAHKYKMPDVIQLSPSEGERAKVQGRAPAQ